METAVNVTLLSGASVWYFSGFLHLICRHNLQYTANTTASRTRHIEKPAAKSISGESKCTRNVNAKWKLVTDAWYSNYPMTSEVVCMLLSDI